MMAIVTLQEYVPRFVITVGGQVLELGFTVDVQSVSVTDNCNDADSFTFSMRDRYPDPGRARFPGSGPLEWMDGGLLEEGKEVKIELGYRGAAMQTLIGVITSVSPTFPESGVPTLQVQGRSLYDRLNKQCTNKAFKAKTDSDIAQEIAALPEVGLSSSVDPTKAEHPLLSSESGTYANILRRRADRIGYELTVKERTLYFEQPRYLVDKGPALTLEWGRNLKSFTPTLSTYKKVTHVTVRASQTSYAKGKDPLEGSVGPGDEGAKMGKETASQIAQRISGKNEIFLDDHSAVSQEEAKLMARARLEASSLDFISGSGACNGNPRLKARTLIELKGVGKRFSGNYYVTSATHTIDGSGYRTTFQVKRNGI
jgi:uncharacterized protein